MTSEHPSSFADSPPPSSAGTRRSSDLDLPRQDDRDLDANNTVRRNRPNTINRITTQGYGSIISQGPASGQEQRPALQSQTRPGPKSRASEQTQHNLSPEQGFSNPRPPKPSLPRRLSSKYPLPYRGQEFSTEDDPEEYEIDSQKQQRPGITSRGSLSSPGLRRQTSTLRRRQTVHSHLPRVDSLEEDEQEVVPQASSSARQPSQPAAVGGREEDTNESPDITEQDDPVMEDEGDEEDDISDAESFTLKDRQQAINQTHPFGIRIWKPALYKKNRSVERSAEGDIHSAPGGRVDRWLLTFNFLWTILFGWWLAIFAALGALACFFFWFAPGAAEYGRVLWGLASYILYPFGKFVKLHQDEAYAEEDQGEGRSIGEYERWQNGDLEDGRLFFGPKSYGTLIGRRRNSVDSAGETDSLLARIVSAPDQLSSQPKRRLFGRGEWTVGRVIYFVFFYFLIAPLLLTASLMCWFMVFWIPMGRLTLILFDHLRRHPLALSFHSDASYSRGPGTQSSSILLCTYRAVGTKYWKYTIEGTNIFLINLIGVVLFVILDYWVFQVALGLDNWIVNPGLIFALALFSIIPLAYFIGQAVASISAQSSMGLGAAINAFFSTIVEVFLYCVALNQGKGQLVEGSLIGSIFAGVLLLPGLSMCFGAIYRKTQRFNVKSAGVTSTMLLFAVIASFGPTLFYQIYGSHELICHSCAVHVTATDLDEDCRRCFFSQVPAVNDRFFIQAVRPYCWFAAVMLFLSYVIGLWFTLRTHAAVIWNDAVDEKKLPAVGHGSISHQMVHQASSSKLQSTSGGANRIPIRDTQLYKRILSQSLKQAGLSAGNDEETQPGSGNDDSHSTNTNHILYLVPPKTPGAESTFADTGGLVEGLSNSQNAHLVKQVAEMAATAATVAARDAVNDPRRTQLAATHTPSHRAPPSRAPSLLVLEEGLEAPAEPGTAPSGGHDAPNWSRMKSYIILLGATLLYAIIAEILVSTVDVVLESVDIDEKFLGITLFALVPNTTEFLNAISFAMQGNIALSMEIGSAYALQVCLLQIPTLVIFSAISGQYVDPEQLLKYTFNLIFPQWDMVTVILCVFLLSYVYGEGKSNYFKGSILVLTYLVILFGFYQAGISASMGMGLGGVNRFETFGAGQKSFKTVGRYSSGQAFS